MIGVASLSGWVRSTHSTEPSSIAETKAANGFAETETMLKHRADPLDDADCARADQDVRRWSFRGRISIRPPFRLALRLPGAPVRIHSLRPTKEGLLPRVSR